MGQYHTVAQGEYLQKIAQQYGFRDWKTIYEAAENKEFRDKRPNPNVIYPGDQIYIPDKNTKQEQAQTGASHQYRIKRAELKFKLVIRDPDGTVFDKEPYELTFIVDGVDQEVLEGTTNGSGALEHPLPDKCEKAVLYLVRQRRRYMLDVGHLDPVMDPLTNEPVIEGIQARLNNLGFFCGAVDGVLGPETQRALKKFQRARMDRRGPDGVPDPDTCKALEREHGS